ncbi:Mo-dependent nitrogenase family protein [Stanieria cyanosphaera PCC 7437]|uniref:Mo-dependent nitrogenase family protein n=1 Tax=Stanieria cyanosphaera (strain ATCC 29371 / PCC 7437) TaxID=111780 RepID=K9XVP7_STAC7|nr:Mo-dependent nitrogenase C-terminal domain-containing protein [Stanieria cyanosphaera]AFZ35747.1 Mo-dependent nitrogenase family protein [Stanieria cyanosphaera PCC 7437]
MNVKEYTAKNIFFSGWINNNQQKNKSLSKFDIFSPLRQWLNELEICDRILAHRLCQLIPTQCPFERKIKLFGKTIIRIPPLCKLNPLYEEVVALRFRAICYLADQCGEDVSCYC